MDTGIASNDMTGMICCNMHVYALRYGCMHTHPHLGMQNPRMFATTMSTDMGCVYIFRHRYVSIYTCIYIYIYMCVCIRMYSLCMCSFHFCIWSSIHLFASLICLLLHRDRERRRERERERERKNKKRGKGRERESEEREAELAHARRGSPLTQTVRAQSCTAKAEEVQW